MPEGEEMNKIRVSVFLSLILFAFSAGLLSAEVKKVEYMGMNETVMKNVMSSGPWVNIDESVSQIYAPVTVGVIINAPREIVWNVITDYERYLDFIPNLKQVKILEKTANTTTVFFEVLAFKVGIIEIDTVYTLKFTFYPHNKVIISWVSGKVKSVNGSWELFPIEGGKKTAAFYTLSGDYSHATLGSKFLFQRQPELHVTSSFTGNIVLLKAVKKEAEKKTGTRK